MDHFEAIRPQLDKVQQRALIVGVVALIGSVVGAFMDSSQFFQSYLFGYLFWLGLALGGLAVLSLHHLAGGGWGLVIQRSLESASRTLPLMILLFIPIFFGMKELYIWARPEVVADDVILQHKAAYLNEPFFWIRAVIFFLVWYVFIFFLNKWSIEQDRTGDIEFAVKMRRIAGPSFIFYVLMTTFASVDWVMSLDPHWFSTIFGFLFVIGHGVTIIAFATIVVAKLSKEKPLSDVIQPKHFHDLGNLMLAFISLWAYINLSQFLIIWSGNLPEEIPWYLVRMNGGWEWVGLFVVIFQFVVPFALLLSRRNKRSVQILTRIAFAVIIVRFFDLFWIVAPNFHEHSIHVHWLDFVTPIAIGGLWIAAFVWQLKGRALLPQHDPRLQEVFSHE